MSEILSPKYKFVKDGVFYYSAAFPKSIAATIRLLELHFLCVLIWRTSWRRRQERLLINWMSIGFI